jgi:hypothetical protein
VTPRSDPPCPIGLIVNRVVAERVRALVDEFGDYGARPSPDAARRNGLIQLLRAVLRSLRLESVDGHRYRLTRRGDDLLIERLTNPPDGLRIPRMEVTTP